ncbi:phosphoglycerate mutase-like protein [Exidia glandulosa HHB12029]|uniref:Phosphoglycerate mutase-like protein n=1 Tax=Exidia glandulosa HHB12029 TaxID=1314781 RepID=A0A166MNM4_EXIGL|nr:phosphoglycerate mutase-like protein [Exidia glandulosa HHB12029]
MGRHGDRFPLASELPFTTAMVAKLDAAKAAISKAKLPTSLSFLKSGYVSTLGTNDLTARGRQTLFEHGVAMKIRYPHLQATTILAGIQDRVEESAQWFARGYFGRAWDNSTYERIAEDAVTPSWITPMNTCKGWQYAFGNNATIEWGALYLPPIAKRLNKAITGLNFTNDDVHGALWACAYDLAALGPAGSPWCGAFTKSELADFTYELDLLMTGAFGYNLPGTMGETLGSLYVARLVDHLTSTNTTQSMFLEFGHDTTIDLALTALGLFDDKSALSSKGPVKASRKWKTSEQVPFGAQMLWERFTCSSKGLGAGKPQVRLLLNDAPVPLASCSKGDGKRFGTCSVGEFVKANQKAASVQWGDASWVAACGAQ